MALAWYTAALHRTKKMPPLKQLLNPPKTRRLTGEEKAKRAAEFRALSKRMGGEKGG